jgi:hypothetical protein
LYYKNEEKFDFYNTSNPIRLPCYIFKESSEERIEFTIPLPKKLRNNRKFIFTSGEKNYIEI